MAQLSLDQTSMLRTTAKFLGKQCVEWVSQLAYCSYPNKHLFFLRTSKYGAYSRAALIFKETKQSKLTTQ